MPGEYRVRISHLYVSAKVTIREIDGTEYQLKKRIAEMILAAGFSRKVQRGLHQMVSVKLSHALRVLTREWDRGDLNPEGPPECTLATYPVKDMTSNPRPFGYHQNWATF
jgi:hypothetical protein